VVCDVNPILNGKFYVLLSVLFIHSNMMFFLFLLSKKKFSSNYKKHCMFSGIITDNKFTNYLSLKTESEKIHQRMRKLLGSILRWDILLIIFIFFFESREKDQSIIKKIRSWKIFFVFSVDWRGGGVSIGSTN